jgi:tRNA pseudouridine55 synthase
MSSFNGVLPVDKPAGYTSFDVIARLRGMAKTRKLGHAGTLDPMATGVLPVFFGRAAKAADLLPCHDKAYEAELKLGVVTDTYDTTGNILETRPVHHEDAITDEAEARRVLASFAGEQEQLPPMYSAVRVGGQRLYKLARAGKTVERAARKITVYDIALTAWDAENASCRISVRCSRGTYIRSVCHDFGQRLGCGAAMSALRRTEACGFKLADCVTLDEAQRLCDGGLLLQRLLPVESLFAEYARLELTQPQAARFINGAQLKLDGFAARPAGNQALAVYAAGRFLGLARADTGAETLKIIKLFALNTCE